MSKFKLKTCEHLNGISEVKPSQVYQCQECVKTGDTWLHLRTCQSCGVTLCCDSSPNKHASKHASSYSHPVASSAEPNEKWMWCYEHKLIKKY
ncbi:UBP-type zinc finger domain-containing protein [uncultured Winogradskyella sp.]|uniref:UBP-type zinc finger domain-containing protein n=1 Tax=uncultured Winogradskyella sp. TaxID=395353 RepID=UPI00260ECA31|nr:UBP-type zinc finger domain-containing protein [uncultured Winogradskyella sp.]